MKVLSFLFYLQEKLEEPFEITLFAPLAGLIFCGLPVLAAGLFFWFLIRPVRDRKDAFSDWVRAQEKLSEEQSPPISKDSNDH